jgi:SAM-dependent methyltransferase
MESTKYYSNQDGERDHYIINSRTRAQAVVNELKKYYGKMEGQKPLKILEVGRMPDNLMTMAISDLIEDNISVIEAPDCIWPGEHYHISTVKETFTHNSHQFTFDITRLNIEKDKLPYLDESFDLILFCEVMEHLLYDPVFALHELGRVLKKKGILAVSMPNAICWLNIAVMLANKNPRDLYSGYGPYGRHAREFSMYELRNLLELQGFFIISETQCMDFPLTESKLKKFIFLLGNIIFKLPFSLLNEKRGNTIICLARKENEITKTYPRWLFRSRYGKDGNTLG